MLFNSMSYLVFLPVVILIYFIIPKKIRYLWLLAASYYFYMCWDAKYAFLILICTVITYISGILLEYIKNRQTKHEIKLKKIVLVFNIISNLGILFYFKYTNFFIDSLVRVFKMIHVELNVPTFDIILPVGISFFTFQALGYTIDVYRNEMQAERNFFKYALFVSFFPQLVAGPIERSKNLLHQLGESDNFNPDKAASGLLSIVYGLFLKIVVADNIAALIDPIFNTPESYTGMNLLVATVLFAFQIYCDFEGYTRMAIGSARILGFHLNENFDAPYMARSIKDFWRRWHISLTSWFRDYLYIPLGGSRKGNFRKQINTLIIFLCSGLWHGAAWHYVAWGGLNGLFSVLEDVFKPLKSWMFYRFKINEQTITYKNFQRIKTFILIDITWLFFRAQSLKSALQIVKRITTEFQWQYFQTAGYMGVFIATNRLVQIVISLSILFVVDIVKYKEKDINTIIFQQQIVFRWFIYWLLFIIIIYWGAYGTDYVQTQFIYFQF